MHRYLTILTLFISIAIATRVFRVPYTATYSPPHVPIQVVPPTPDFSVPWWMGGYVTSTNETSNWTLPLTYPNGGRTPVGSTLIIQNQGPFNITLYTTYPETIQGLDSYLIVADSTVSILTAPDWVVVSNTFGSEGSDGVFSDLRTVNATVDCSLVVGSTLNISNTVAPKCGDLTTSRAFIDDLTGCTLTAGALSSWNNASRTCGDANIVRLLLGPGATHAPSSFTGEAIDARVIIGTTTSLVGYAYNATTLPTTTNIYRGMRFVMGTSGEGNYTPQQIGATFIAQHDAAGSLSSQFTSLWTDVRMGANFTGTAALTVAHNVIPVSVSSGSPTGTITDVVGIRFAQPSRGSGPMTFTNVYDIDFTSQSVATTGNSVFIRMAAISGGAINNAGIWANSNTQFNIICAGTAFDTCISRAAANVWTFNAATSLRVPGYTCIGCSSAPTNVAAGAFSTTIASPALQAFGAVTANAASGVLAFTVSTASQTCQTATVTNTNVVAVSEVMLTIQSYSGTQYTNGIPRVFRSNTAGSSAGSFIIQLCNDHATNALSGNLYVAFWVLN